MMIIFGKIYKLTPSYFISKQGDEWKPWPLGAVDSRELHNPIEFIRTGKHWCSIDTKIFANKEGTVHVAVHALLFGEPYELEVYPRWDCINGWTTKPTLARWEQENG